jgi:hypothetical protein
MRRLVRPILFALALLCGVSAVGGYFWYRKDRSGMLAFLCKAGLPNFSRPAPINADDLGCGILSPRRRVEGVLLTGFEASNLVINDLGPAPEGGGFTGSTWWRCNQQRGCDQRLDRQLDEEIAGLCDTGLARVTAYGWATETPGHYGHLGVYSREFFVDEIVNVGPPPADLVAHMRRERNQPENASCR